MVKNIAPGRSSAGRVKRRERSIEIIALLKSEQNELKKKLLLVGYLSEKVSDSGGSIFLVGGQAVETYTAGQFTTGDIDITTTDKERTEKTLEQIRFKKEGMIWLGEPLGLAVHIVSEYPSRSQNVRKIEVGQYMVNIIGVEDLIVDRLAAAKLWKSERDKEQAIVLFKTFANTLDRTYLSRRAEEMGVTDKLPH
jgi:hypothetical protein